MSIHEQIKKVLNENKAKIQLIQFAISNAVGSFVYTEYLKQFKQKEKPVPMIMVPSIKSVNEFLNKEGSFVEALSENLIEDIRNDVLFNKWKSAPEFVVFNDDNIEILKTIFDLVLIPNIIYSIPYTISKKFGIGDPKNQTFIESNDIDLFNRKKLTSKQYLYISHESVLNLLAMAPSIQKNIEVPESNVDGFFLAEDEFLTIGNPNAISPIHLDLYTINNIDVIGDIKFVTNTEIRDIKTDETIIAVKDNKHYRYGIKTSALNQTAVTRLIGVLSADDCKPIEITEATEEDL